MRTQGFVKFESHECRNWTDDSIDKHTKRQRRQHFMLTRVELEGEIRGNSGSFQFFQFVVWVCVQRFNHIWQFLRASIFTFQGYFVTACETFWYRRAVEGRKGCHFQETRSKFLKQCSQMCVLNEYFSQCFAAKWFSFGFWLKLMTLKNLASAFSFWLFWK